MKNFKSILPSELTENFFTEIGKNWMLISAGNKKSFNTMTASWGGTGFLWNENVTMTFVRPQRHTYEFTESNDYYSLCFFKPEHKSILSFCGSHSGRDFDKIKETGLTTLFHHTGTPYYQEAKTVIICKKHFATTMKETDFLSQEVVERCYPKKDFHKMYIGGIVDVLVTN